MKSKITFDIWALLCWCTDAYLDQGYVCRPRHTERWIALADQVLMTDVDIQRGSAVLDWEVFENVLLMAETSPQLVVENGFFTFGIATPLKDYPGYRPMITGSCTDAVRDVFAQETFQKLLGATMFQ